VSTRRLTLSPVDLQVLGAVNRFRYLTAEQLNRILWPENTKDNNRYAQRRLKRLADFQYVLPLAEVSDPTVPRVHALGWRGRQALVALGEHVPSYYRPSELAETARNRVFMPHTLGVVDVLIAAERLTSDVPDVRLTRLLLERDLRSLSMRVRVAGVRGFAPPRDVTVVPDAVFSLLAGEEVSHFVLEVDRGTERKTIWRGKVAALSYWINSHAGRALFPAGYVTVMVVTTNPARCEQLRLWTAEALETHNLFETHAGLFALTSASPVALPPKDFFTGRHWLPPYTGSADSLITFPGGKPLA
jgi:hypothetical protein